MLSIYTTQHTHGHGVLQVRESNQGGGYCIELLSADTDARVSLVGLDVGHLVELVDGATQLLADLEHPTT